VHHARGLADDVLEEDGGPLARAHALHEPVADVLKPVRPRELHQLENFEELRDVQVLLRRDNVDHLVECILFEAFDRTADVAREVD
jgi:hypothetical protein